MTSRTLYFTAPRRVELRVEPDAPLAEGTARVRTRVSAISAGTELLFYRGEVEAGVPVDATLPWAGTFAYPLAYGYAAVGCVEALGPGVDASLQGARVFAFQPHRESFVLPAAQLVRLPDAIDDESAALLPNVETALSLAMDGAASFGERVAVLGQGVVGQLLAALLVRSGAEHVALFDRRPERLEHSRMLCGPARAAWCEAVREDQHGAFDLVYELTGDPAALDDAGALARYEGRIVIGSWYGKKRAPIDFGTRAHRGRNTLLFSQVSRIDSKHAARFDAARRLEVALAWLERLPVTTLVTHRFAFDRIAEAYALLDQQREPALQVLITYRSED